MVDPGQVILKVNNMVTVADSDTEERVLIALLVVEEDQDIMEEQVDVGMLAEEDLAMLIHLSFRI